MIGYKNSYPPDCYDKVWNPAFSKNRKFSEENCPYGEWERAFDADGDNIAIFFRNLEDSVPSLEIEEVVEFCGSIRLDDLKLGAGTAGKRQAAWLDERSYGAQGCSCKSSSKKSSGKNVRKHENPLTATEIHQRLQVPV
jgi:hypothetical protein